MIKLDENFYNQKGIDVKFFSDGTQRINGLPKLLNPNMTTIKWIYESESELTTLQYLVMYIRDMYPGIEISLYMPYVPNARMDRVEDEYEVFTLKYFARIINSLDFKDVTVFDTHSKVTDALIDRIKVISPNAFIDRVKHLICGHDTFDICRGIFKENDKFIYFFPDKGAYDKYKKLKSVTTECAGVLYGDKYRNWDTCEIEKFNVMYADGETSGNFDTPVLIIDDIISSGGTIVKSVEDLKMLGFKNIYVYCTHLENRFDTEETNKLRGMLESGEIKGLYTTNSLYTQNNSKVTVLNLSIYD